MAKMTRSNLKHLVKECLIEILAEGLSDSPSALQESVDAHHTHAMGLGRRESHVAESMSKRQRRTAALDTPIGDKRIVPNINFDDNVRNAVQTLSADPIMQEILTDTARGSLQHTAQMDPELGSVAMSEGVKGPNPSAGPQLQADPSEIFEQIAPGSSSKWADLAFAAPARPGHSR